MRQKTILIAHRRSDVRDRFAAALADAKHGFVSADNADQAIAAAADRHAPISLALVDAGLSSDAVALIEQLRRGAGPSLPVVMFASSVESADQIRALIGARVAGYVNEYASTMQILPALAPHLFPDNFNRRASPRLVLGLPVSFRAGQTIAGAMTLNIGKGGVAIRTMTPLPPDTQIQLRFRLPGLSDETDVGGRVAWSDQKAGMGIQFVRIEPADQAAIDAFVDRGQP